MSEILETNFILIFILHQREVTDTIFIGNK